MLQKAPADVSRHIVGPKSFFSLDLNNETPVDKMQHYTHSNWPLCFLWFLQGSAAVTRNLQIVRWSYDLTSFCALFNPLFKKKKSLNCPVHLTVPFWWHHQSGVSAVCFPSSLTRISPVFVFFSFSLCFFLFHVSLGWCWILIGGGARLVLWRCPSTRLDGPNTVAPHQPMAAFKWLPPPLLCWQTMI